MNNPVMYLDSDGKRSISFWSEKKSIWQIIRDSFVNAGKVIDDGLLAIAGGLITLASIPIVLFVPGGGLVPKLDFQCQCMEVL